MTKYLEGQSINGIVCKGNQLGRTIGFPTANILVGNENPSDFGVYVATVDLPDRRRCQGVANLGVKPTIGSEQPLLEVHIFDFAEDIYGEEIHVRLHKRLRAEQRFPSLDALKKQLQHDRKAAAEAHRTWKLLHP